MQYNDIINNGILVYQSQASDTKLREWRIEERSCSVKFYRTQPLSELDLVILRLVQSLEENNLTKEELGLTLGFDVSDTVFGKKRYYKDTAEVALFNKILDRVIEWKLLKEEALEDDSTETDNDSVDQETENNSESTKKKEVKKIIRLTRLGHKALEKNCKFMFFLGKKVLYTNINKSDRQEDTTDFPFYKALGFATEITDICEDTDFDPDAVDIDHCDELINRIANQSSTSINIYAAKTLNKWKYSTKYVDVKLYKCAEEFYPLIVKDDIVSVEATDILYRSQNTHLFNHKVKKALYYKLINNADSVINYSEIKLFEDEIEEDEFNLIVKDKRTDWNDDATYKYIVSNEYCTEKVWDIISIYCPVDVVIPHISDLDAKFDMISLSRRLPISFIIENCAQQAWNMNVVLSREDISKYEAQQLMLCETNLSTEWDWELIHDYIDIDFVTENIDKLNLDFYNLTSWLPVECYSLIIDHSDKKWNWLLFVNTVEINMLITHIKQFQDKIGVYMEHILDRIFQDSNLSKLAIQSEDFAEVLRASKTSGYLFSFNLGSKSSYVWNDELIEYLEKCGVLVWNTADGVPGFSRYSYIHWNSAFFEKYYNRITSNADAQYISQTIDNLSLISQYQDFNWDWEGLSQNNNFYGLEAFLELGKEKVRYDLWMVGSNISFTPEFFVTHRLWMLNEINASYVSKSIKDYGIVLENPTYPWNWNILAQNSDVANDDRFSEVLAKQPELLIYWVRCAKTELIEKNFDRLHISTYVNRIQSAEQNIPYYAYSSTIWDRLSESLSVQFIENHLSENWNRETITRRLLASIEGSNIILERGKNILNWDILSNELASTVIENCLNDYTDLWNWDAITERVSPEFIHSNFKNYLSYWNHYTAMRKIAPLITIADISNPDTADFWNWQVISELSSKEFLLSVLEEKEELLDWNEVTRRICTFKDCDLQTLFSKETVSHHLNWGIINTSLQLSNILKCKDIESAKWDWNIITQRYDTDFIITHLKEYSSYWDWNVVLHNKFDRNYIVSHLESVKDAVSQLDALAKQDCWKTITRLYEPPELLLMSEKLSPLNGYYWDYSYIYQSIGDPEEFINREHSYVDRTAFSACDAVNRMFEYDANSFVFRTWKTIVKSKLNNPKFGWDYKELTKHSSIQAKNEVFYSINPDSWDWDYISQFGNCLLPEHKGKYMRKYKNRLNFNLISLREDIGIDDDMIHSYIEESWDWQALSKNQGTKLSFDFIFRLREKAWDWQALSKNNAIKWNIKTLKQILKTPDVKELVSWDDVVSKTELKIDDSVLKLMSDIDFSWLSLTGNKSYVPSIDSVSNADKAGKEIDWTSLSKNKNINVAFAREFKNLLDWTLLTSNVDVIDVNNESVIDEFVDLLDWEYVSQNMPLSMSRIIKYKDKLIWTIVNKRFDYSKIEVSKIESIKELVDWTKVSSSSIVFTEEFLHQYRDKIDWHAFSRNESVDFSADLYKDFAKDLNRIKFIDTLSECDCHRYSSLKVYHFSHMFNAIDIIKNRKILSRNKAEASHSLKYDAAGSVVHRTNKAHPYARFYFRPKSPTQFYNECLGWDRTLKTSYGKSYYSKACGLHLPKCPLPIFFEFDVREVITKLQDKCYYSTGNLQTNAASIFKVDETPGRIRTDNLYYDVSEVESLTKKYFAGEFVSKSTFMSKFYDYFNRIFEQSQQEFLVLDELDFSDLESLRIFCYDKYQKKLLLQYLGDDPITAKIEVNDQMYSYHNRKLDITEDEDTITITSDYDLGGCAYMLVKGGIVINSSSIKNTTPSGVIVYPSVTFDKKNLPSEIIFVDPNPIAGTKEWLIYKS